MEKIRFNIILNFVYQLLLLVAPLVTAPYVSRILGANGVGKYSFVVSITTIFSNLVLLGLPKYGSREIAFVQNEKKDRSQRFLELYTIQGIAFSIFFFVYISIIIIRFIQQKDSVLQLIYGIPVLLAALFNVNWYFWGVEKFRITVSISSFVKIINIILIFFLIKNETDLYKYILLYGFSLLISNLCLFILLKKEISFVHVNMSEVARHVIPVTKFFIPVIAISIYKLMDKIMLGIMSNMGELGVYENAEKVINVPIALISAFGITMLPRISALLYKKENASTKKYLNISLVAVSGMTILFLFGYIALGTDFVVLFFGNDFLRVGLIMKILAVSIVFLGMGDVLRSQILIPEEMDHVYLVSAVIGAAVNVVVNLVLIPFCGAVGAAVGTVCAEFVVFFYQFLHVRKHFNYMRLLSIIVFYLLCGILMQWVMSLFSFESLLLTFMLKVFIGTIVYSSISFCILFFLRRKIYC